MMSMSEAALAHGVAEGDKAFIQANPGVNIIPYMYLGAKHMVTGYDHLLFLFGVIFFLYRLKDVWTYVTHRSGALPPIMAEQALASGSPANNPIIPSADEIQAIYR
jgi:hypothetical protein